MTYMIILYILIIFTNTNIINTILYNILYIQVYRVYRSIDKTAITKLEKD